MKENNTQIVHWIVLRIFLSNPNHSTTLVRTALRLFVSHPGYTFYCGWNNVLQFGYEASFKNALYWKVHFHPGALFKKVLESWKGGTRWRKHLTGDGSSGLNHFWPLLVDCKHLVLDFGFYILCYILVLSCLSEVYASLILGHPMSHAEKLVHCSALTFCFCFGLVLVVCLSLN